MKKVTILSLAALSCMLYAEDTVKPAVEEVKKDNAVVAEANAENDAVAKRRAEIKARLEANKKISADKTKDTEYNKRMALMKEQQQKTQELRLKVQATENAINARKEVVVKTNEDAAALAKEISELEAQLKEKKEAVEKIIAADEEYIKLVALKKETQKKLSEETNKTAEVVRQNMKARFQSKKEATEEVESEEKKAQ